MSPTQAKDSWEEVHPIFTSEQAEKETSRCLPCGCAGYHKCKLITLINQLDANPHKYRAKSPSSKSSTFHSTEIHDPAKCILCGLCVRACKKRRGYNQGLLSSARRGMKTFVNTELLGSPPCEGCADCADICPTGAMQPRLLAPHSPNC